MISRNLKIRSLLIATVFLGLNACSFSAFGPVSNVYCDNFLVYDMCAQDLNGDGEVEYVYFADSLDVFMYREGGIDNVPAPHEIHRCAQLMDEDLVATTSRVFTVTDNTSYLEKQDIRGAMMLKYISYMPRVTACNLGADEAAEGADS